MTAVSESGRKTAVNKNTFLEMALVAIDDHKAATGSNTDAFRIFLLEYSQMLWLFRCQRLSTYGQAHRSYLFS